MQYIFVVDTSASMNAVFSDGLSALEVAKSGIEHFFKWELRKPDRRNRYALVTFDDSPLGFKALFKDAEHELLDCVRSLQATDLSNASQALASVFDLLSAHRLRSRMDVPGLGRFPGGHESTLIFWFTDGGRLSSAAGVADRISIPGLRIPGCEFFIEPFRWEQRLFTIVLQPDTIPLAQFVRPMSDAMGGDVWWINSARSMIRSMENCLGVRRHLAVAPAGPVSHIEGVSVVFERHPSCSAPPWPPERVQIHASFLSPRNFPIPEAFWPDSCVRPDGLRLPPRQAHPTILVLKRNESQGLLQDFPVDRFSMSSAGFLKELKDRRSNACWLLYVADSYKKKGPGHPFGFIKYRPATDSPNIYILPYNYPVLFKLLSDARSFQVGKVPDLWTRDFLAYLSDVPCYYWQPIKNALAHIRMPHLWPASAPIPPLVTRIAEHVDKAARLAGVGYDKLLAENVFDVPKDMLAGQLDAARRMLLEPGQQLSSLKRKLTQRELDDLHSVPIARMGDYAHAMERTRPLRNALEDEAEAAERERTLFGNPYARRKRKLLLPAKPSEPMSPGSPQPPAGSSSGMLGKIEEEVSMDEAAEEASQLGDDIQPQAPVPPTSAPVRWRPRTTKAPKPFSRHRLPGLSGVPSPAIVVPQFKRISWRMLEAGDFDLAVHLRSVRSLPHKMGDGEREAATLAHSPPRAVPEEPAPAQPSQPGVQMLTPPPSVSSGDMDEAKDEFDLLPEEVLMQSIIEPEPPQIGKQEAETPTSVPRQETTSIAVRPATGDGGGMGGIEQAIQRLGARVVVRQTSTPQPLSMHGSADNGAATQNAASSSMETSVPSAVAAAPEPPQPSQSVLVDKDRVPPPPSRRTGVLAADWGGFVEHAHRMLMQWPGAFKEADVRASGLELVHAAWMPREQQRRRLAYLSKISRNMRYKALATHIDGLLVAVVAAS
ncbi:hypothetical protein HK105_202911 [Polyrhizophydium stewartii]|uniref:VWFA domain-containing protein n=1 Tax=Polyrhizophydium stewartii TaxID=2732419 RepID=A0ABR4NDP2_9FUNG